MPERPATEPLEVNASLVVAIGTAAWFVAFCILLPLHDRVDHQWIWTALAGWALGLIGLPLIRAQRRAAERRRAG
ncbi:MAG TPA: DUF2530 domain-containing protein [Mycobacteriales bacterium]|nr:DUF2530 domain-containing protein [Mycobacteriales bacterium]